jgi:endonuclease-8
MPEGPTLILLREEAAAFVGQTIEKATGNTRAFPLDTLAGQKVLQLRSWGKHFLIVLPTQTIRIHFLMWGSYRINERKATNPNPRLSLAFPGGRELNFYACSVKLVDIASYDWRADVLSEEWDPALAHKKVRAAPEQLACDALLNQEIFSGVGNIIKNEVLFRIGLHPLARVGDLPSPKLHEMVEQARVYSFEFLAWKREFVLKKNWLAHTKSTCPRCSIPFKKGKLGKYERRSFYCERCQQRLVFTRLQDKLSSATANCAGTQ